MENFRKVTRKEFQEFIGDYPKKLELDVCRIFMPPLVTYNDFDLAPRWPDSVVAKTMEYDDDPSGMCYEPEENLVYKIRSGIKF